MAKLLSCNVCPVKTSARRKFSAIWTRLRKFSFIFGQTRGQNIRTGMLDYKKSRVRINELILIIMWDKWPGHFDVMIVVRVCPPLHVVYKVVNIVKLFNLSIMPFGPVGVKVNASWLLQSWLTSSIWALITLDVNRSLCLLFFSLIVPSGQRLQKLPIPHRASQRQLHLLLSRVAAIGFLELVWFRRRASRLPKTGEFGSQMGDGIQ